MKKLMSAAVVFAVVGSAFAFKPLGQGHVYCNTTGIQNPVCNSNTKIDYDETTTNTGITNPCPTGKSPYILSGSNCVTSSSSFFKTTDLL
jgi:hypothetical protein